MIFSTAEQNSLKFMDLFLATIPNAVVMLITASVLGSAKLLWQYQADKLKFSQYVECQHHTTSSIFKPLCSHTTDDILSL